MSLQEQTIQPQRKILRLRDVETQIGFKRGFIYKYIKEGTFPKPIRIGSRSVGWDSIEIDRWVADRLHRQN